MLSTNPLFIQSTPDGSALLVVEKPTEQPLRLRVLYDTSLGITDDGDLLDLPDSFARVTSFAATSFGQRGCLFLSGVDVFRQQVVSVSLQISRKESEYQLQAFRRGDNSVPDPKTAVHNSLLDIFAKTWAQYPVLSAISR